MASIRVKESKTQHNSRKYKKISIETKLRVIHQFGQGMKVIEIARDNDLLEATVCNITKSKDK